jgi:hypothetical protein
MYVPQPQFAVTILNRHGDYQLLFLGRKDAEALDLHERSPSVVRSELLNIVAERMQGRGEVGGTSNALIVAANTDTPEPAPLPQTNPHLNSPESSSTPQTLDSLPTLTYTTTTTSESGHSGYSGGVGPSPPQHPGSYSQSHQRRHYDESVDVLAALTFLECDQTNRVPKPLLPSPQQESRGPSPDMEADGYFTPPVYDTSSDSEGDPSRDSNPRNRSPYGLAESSSLAPVGATTTSESESGTPSAPPLPSCTKC